MRSFQRHIIGTDKRVGKLKKEEGLTILEVIVAISILTVGLLAIASMQTSSITENYTSYLKTEGTNLAQDKLEALMALPYTSLDLQDADPTVGVSTTYSELSPPPGYTITWEVDDDNPAPNTKFLTVRVTWQWPGRSVTETTELTCIKRRF